MRELRIDRGLKQDELAEVLEVSQASVARYENEIIELSIPLIIKICKYFEVSADYLLGLTDY